MLITPVYKPIPTLESNKLLTNDGEDMVWTDTPTVASLISTGIIRASDFAKTGWPVTQGVTLSFDNGTLTFTVTDGGSAYYYIDGVKYTLNGNKTVTITDTEGLWYIYFDGDTLTASQTIWSFQAEDKALVAILYWDAANNKEIFLGWEAHTFHMDGSTHARLHYAGGARWETGLLVTDAGSETINVAAGDIWDEDLNITITDGAGSSLFEQVLSPAELPIYYLDGASNWRIYETTDKANATDAGYVDGSNDLKYNKLNGTWANATVGLNNYVAYYVVATNEQTEPIALIMGQRIDNKLSDAKENNTFGGLTLTGLPFEEMVVLARLILKDTATYTLEEVLDLRVYNIKGNITSPLIPDHGGMAGLGDDDHVHYLLADGTRTLTNLVLGGDPSVISSANAIQLKPSGDTDDYLEFSTVNNVPIITAKGGTGFFLMAETPGNTYQWWWEDATHYGLIGWTTTNDTFDVFSRGKINLQADNDVSDYIQISTTGDVPIIGTVGVCDLKITSSGGNIDFDDENLLFDTWKPADATKSLVWAASGVGSLVLDGTGDYVTIHGVIDTINMTTGSFTGWINLAAGRVGDASTLVALAIEKEDGTANLLIYRTTANKLRARYREGSVNVIAETAEPGTGWKFVAVTWNTAGNLILYVGDPGGGAAATTDLSGRDPMVPEVAIIGERGVGMGQEWEGELSDFTLWDDDLSQAECEAVFDLDRNPTVAEIEAGIANEAEILHWYPFTTDADDYEVSWSTTADADGTFVGEAYVSSTSVAGINTASPALVGPLTVTGAFRTVSNGRVAGSLCVVGDITAANYTAANLLTACATNAGGLDFSAAGKTLTVEDDTIVNQDLTTDANVTFGILNAETEVDATAYKVGGTPGIDFNGAVTNITVEKGIVTAAS